MSETITVTVKAGIGFEDLIPGSADENQTQLDLAQGSRLDCIADLIGLKPSDRYMTALNDAVVVKSERAEVELKSGDVVEILPPLTGG